MPQQNDPKYAELGGDLSLVCNYELEGDELYSIKWYRDEQEFYRYQPSDNPPIRIFSMQGLKVDDLSSQTHLRVENVSLESSGSFKCEVSGGPPRFQTAVLVSRVEVVDLPKKMPSITGMKSSYKLGDMVDAECWTDSAHPEPTIKWWINDNAADPANMNIIVHDHSKVTQLSFQIKKKHLSGNTLRVKCSVEILDLYWRSIEEEAVVMENEPTSFSLPTFSKPIFSSSVNLSYEIVLLILCWLVV